MIIKDLFDRYDRYIKNNESDYIIITFIKFIH